MPHSKGGTYRGKGGKYVTGKEAHTAATKKTPGKKPGKVRY
jgi:hypothetical protein